MSDVSDARDDQTVSVLRSRAYAEAARAAGADVALFETAGGHRDPIDPATGAWREAAEWLSAVAPELRA